MKIFISQPMNGRSDEAILEEREAIIDIAKSWSGNDDLEILDSFFEGAPHNTKPLWYLGESLKIMSEADLVVFAPEWSEARGCKIERDCAKMYKIPMITVELL